MILELIKRAVKDALHEATEEWSEEFGLPHEVVVEMRTRRLALAEQRDAQADALAAADLDVEDEELPHALPVRSAARLTAAPELEQVEEGEQSETVSEDADDETLMEWVRQQREAQVSWADVTRLAAEQGHTLTEQALHSRYRRWVQKNGQDEPV